MNAFRLIMKSTNQIITDIKIWIYQTAWSYLPFLSMASATAQAGRVEKKPNQG